MILDITEDHYMNGVYELKNEILSGKLQREMLEANKCLKCTATFEELK